MLMLFVSIASCIIGFASGFACTAVWLSRSNNIGDSKGIVEDFIGYPVRVLHAQDKISDSPF